MQESEAKKLLMALDGIAAYLETTRTLVLSMIVAPPAPQQEVIEDLGRCKHENVLNLETMAGSTQLCNDCGDEV